MCDNGRNCNKTWNKAQCSLGDDWKLRLSENLCPLGATFTD